MNIITIPKVTLAHLAEFLQINGLTFGVIVIQENSYRNAANETMSKTVWVENVTVPLIVLVTPGEEL